MPRTDEARPQKLRTVPAPSIPLSEAAMAAAREFARKGAMTVNATRTAAERSRLARKAVRARWARYRKAHPQPARARKKVGGR